MSSGGLTVTCTPEDCSHNKTSWAHAASPSLSCRGFVGEDATLPACRATSTIHGIDHSQRNPTTTAPPITADGSHLPVRAGVRATQREGERERGREGERREGERGWSGVGKERKKERTSKKGRGDKRVQLVKPSMLNFAKTDAEPRPACALLIIDHLHENKEAFTHQLTCLN